MLMYQINNFLAILSLTLAHGQWLSVCIRMKTGKKCVHTTCNWVDWNRTTDILTDTRWSANYVVFNFPPMASRLCDVIHSFQETFILLIFGYTYNRMGKYFTISLKCLPQKFKVTDFLYYNFHFPPFTSLCLQQIFFHTIFFIIILIIVHLVAVGGIGVNAGCLLLQLQLLMLLTF